MMSKKLLMRIMADPGLPARRLARILLKRARLRPSSEPFISGDSFRNLATHVFDETNKVSVLKIQAGDIVFCNGDLLPEFSEAILKKLSVPIVVILGNSDRNYSDLDGSVFHSELRHKYFVQNLVDEIPNCVPVPIGLENRHWQNVGRPSDFSRFRKREASRTNRIMWSFTVRTNKPLRKVAERVLRENPVANNIGEVSPKAHRRALTTYSFVASPPGNGWDTHRTWEALYLGCIPIVLDSYFARSFFEQGVPLWIVQTYSDLSGLTESDLQRKYIELSAGFNSRHLWFDYWAQTVNESSRVMRVLHNRTRRLF